MGFCWGSHRSRPAGGSRVVVDLQSCANQALVMRAKPTVRAYSADSARSAQPFDAQFPAEK
jgi:hypothetical protein